MPTSRPKFRSPIAVVASVVLATTVVAACQPADRTTQIGTFTPHLVNGSVSYSNGDVITEAKALGVTLERQQQVVGRALGSDITAYRRAGIASQVTIKANAGTATQPLATAAQRTTFERDLNTLLDQYKTPLLAVENEETVDKFYTGTPDEYLTELRIATKVAKARRIPVTNGGIPWPPMALVTWNHLRLTKGTATADAFLATVFRGASTAWIVRDLTGVARTDPDPYGKLSREGLRGSWKDAEYLFANYGTDAGDVAIDYVNFHWYVADSEGYRTGGYSEARALHDAINTIRDLTGKTAVTNEVGQRSTRPETVRGTLRVLVDEAKLPFVIWFDADGIPAMGLFTTPGDLRLNGKAFAAFVGT